MQWSHPTLSREYDLKDRDGVHSHCKQQQVLFLNSATILVLMSSAVCLLITIRLSNYHFIPLCVEINKRKDRAIISPLLSHSSALHLKTAVLCSPVQGFELNGMKIAVRYPDRIPHGMGISKSALRADDLQDENIKWVLGIRFAFQRTAVQHRSLRFRVGWKALDHMWLCSNYRPGAGVRQLVVVRGSLALWINSIVCCSWLLFVQAVDLSCKPQMIVFTFLFTCGKQVSVNVKPIWV